MQGIFLIKFTSVINISYYYYYYYHHHLHQVNFQYCIYHVFIVSNVNSNKENI
jgi:hypothetical protein